MGLLGLGDGFPAALSGVEQRAVPAVPAACDKCGNRQLAVEGREVFCSVPAGCGRIWVLIDPQKAPVPVSTLNNAKHRKPRQWVTGG